MADVFLPQVGLDPKLFASGAAATPSCSHPHLLLSPSSAVQLDDGVVYPPAEAEGNIKTSRASDDSFAARQQHQSSPPLHVVPRAGSSPTGKFQYGFVVNRFADQGTAGEIPKHLSPVFDGKKRSITYTKSVADFLQGMLVVGQRQQSGSCVTSCTTTPGAHQLLNVLLYGDSEAGKSSLFWHEKHGIVHHIAREYLRQRSVIVELLELGPCNVVTDLLQNLGGGCREDNGGIDSWGNKEASPSCSVEAESGGGSNTSCKGWRFKTTGIRVCNEEELGRVLRLGRCQRALSEATTNGVARRALSLSIYVSKTTKIRIVDCPVALAGMIPAEQICNPGPAGVGKKNKMNAGASSSSSSSAPPPSKTARKYVFPDEANLPNDLTGFEALLERVSLGQPVQFGGDRNKLPSNASDPRSPSPTSRGGSDGLVESSSQGCSTSRPSPTSRGGSDGVAESNNGGDSGGGETSNSSPDSPFLRVVKEGFARNGKTCVLLCVSGKQNMPRTVKLGETCHKVRDEMRFRSVPLPAVKIAYPGRCYDFQLSGAEGFDHLAENCPNREFMDPAERPGTVYMRNLHSTDDYLSRLVKVDLDAHSCLVGGGGPLEDQLPLPNINPNSNLNHQHDHHDSYKLTLSGLPKALCRVKHAGKGRVELDPQLKDAHAYLKINGVPVPRPPVETSTAGTSIATCGKRENKIYAALGDVITFGETYSFQLYRHEELEREDFPLMLTREREGGEDAIIDPDRFEEKVRLLNLVIGSGRSSSTTKTSTLEVVDHATARPSVSATAPQLELVVYPAGGEQTQANVGLRSAARVGVRFGPGTSSSSSSSSPSGGLALSSPHFSASLMTKIAQLFPAGGKTALGKAEFLTRYHLICDHLYAECNGASFQRATPVVVSPTDEAKQAEHLLHARSTAPILGVGVGGGLTSSSATSVLTKSPTIIGPIKSPLLIPRAPPSSAFPVPPTSGTAGASGPPRRRPGERINTESANPFLPTSRLHLSQSGILEAGGANASGFLNASSASINRSAVTDAGAITSRIKRKLAKRADESRARAAAAGGVVLVPGTSTSTRQTGAARGAAGPPRVGSYSYAVQPGVSTLAGRNGTSPPSNRRPLVTKSSSAQRATDDGRAAKRTPTRTGTSGVLRSDASQGSLPRRGLRREDPAGGSSPSPRTVSKSSLKSSTKRSSPPRTGNKTSALPRRPLPLQQELAKTKEVLSDGRDKLESLVQRHSRLQKAAPRTKTPPGGRTRIPSSARAAGSALAPAAQAQLRASAGSAEAAPAAPMQLRPAIADLLPGVPRTFAAMEEGAVVAAPVSARFQRLNIPTFAAISIGAGSMSRAETVPVLPKRLELPAPNMPAFAFRPQVPVGAALTGGPPSSASAEAPVTVTSSTAAASSGSAAANGSSANPYASGLLKYSPRVASQHQRTAFPAQLVSSSSSLGQKLAMPSLAGAKMLCTSRSLSPQKTSGLKIPDRISEEKAGGEEEMSAAIAGRSGSSSGATAGPGAGVGQLRSQSVPQQRASKIEVPQLYFPAQFLGRPTEVVRSFESRLSAQRSWSVEPPPVGINLAGGAPPMLRPNILNFDVATSSGLLNTSSCSSGKGVLGRPRPSGAPPGLLLANSKAVTATPRVDEDGPGVAPSSDRAASTAAACVAAEAPPPVPVPAAAPVAGEEAKKEEQESKPTTTVAITHDDLSKVGFRVRKNRGVLGGSASSSRRVSKDKKTDDNYNSSRNASKETATGSVLVGSSATEARNGASHDTVDRSFCTTEEMSGSASSLLVPAGAGVGTNTNNPYANAHAAQNITKESPAAANAEWSASLEERSREQSGASASGGGISSSSSSMHPPNLTQSFVLGGDHLSLRPQLLPTRIGRTTTPRLSARAVDPERNPDPDEPQIRSDAAPSEVSPHKQSRSTSRSSRVWRLPFVQSLFPSNAQLQLGNGQLVLGKGPAPTAAAGAAAARAPISGEQVDQDSRTDLPTDPPPDLRRVPVHSEQAEPRSDDILQQVEDDEVDEDDLDITAESPALEILKNKYEDIKPPLQFFPSRGRRAPPGAAVVVGPAQQGARGPAASATAPLATAAAAAPPKPSAGHLSAFANKLKEEKLSSLRSASAERMSAGREVADQMKLYTPRIESRFRGSAPDHAANRPCFVAPASNVFVQQQQLQKQQQQHAAAVLDQPQLLTMKGIMAAVDLKLDYMRNPPQRGRGTDRIQVQNAGQLLRPGLSSSPEAEDSDCDAELQEDIDRLEQDDEVDPLEQAALLDIIDNLEERGDERPLPGGEQPQPLVPRAAYSGFVVPSGANGPPQFRTGGGSSSTSSSASAAPPQVDYPRGGGNSTTASGNKNMNNHNQLGGTTAATTLLNKARTKEVDGGTATSRLSSITEERSGLSSRVHSSGPNTAANSKDTSPTASAVQLQLQAGVLNNLFQPIPLLAGEFGGEGAKAGAGGASKGARAAMATTTTASGACSKGTANKGALLGKSGLQHASPLATARPLAALNVGLAGAGGGGNNKLPLGHLAPGTSTTTTLVAPAVIAPLLSGRSTSSASSTRALGRPSDNAAAGDPQQQPGLLRSELQRKSSKRTKGAVSSSGKGSKERRSSTSRTSSSGKSGGNSCSSMPFRAMYGGEFTEGLTASQNRPRAPSGDLQLLECGQVMKPAVVRVNSFGSVSSPKQDETYPFDLTSPQYNDLGVVVGTDNFGNIKPPASSPFSASTHTVDLHKKLIPSSSAEDEGLMGGGQLQKGDDGCASWDEHERPPSSSGAGALNVVRGNQNHVFMAPFQSAEDSPTESDLYNYNKVLDRHRHSSRAGAGGSGSSGAPPPVQQPHQAGAPSTVGSASAISSSSSSKQANKGPSKSHQLQAPPVSNPDIWASSDESDEPRESAEEGGGGTRGATSSSRRNKNKLGRSNSRPPSSQLLGGADEVDELSRISVLEEVSALDNTQPGIGTTGLAASAAAGGAPKRRPSAHKLADYLRTPADGPNKKGWSRDGPDGEDDSSFLFSTESENRRHQSRVFGGGGNNFSRSPPLHRKPGEQQREKRHSRTSVTSTASAQHRPDRPPPKRTPRSAGLAEGAGGGLGDSSVFAGEERLNRTGGADGVAGAAGVNLNRRSSEGAEEDEDTGVENVEVDSYNLEAEDDDDARFLQDPEERRRREQAIMEKHRRNSRRASSNRNHGPPARRSSGGGASSGSGSRRNEGAPFTSLRTSQGIFSLNHIE